MAAWIFQCNPDRFDVDGYLAFAPERIVWLVNQNRRQIQPGDQVFLWRAYGSGLYGPAGIVAESSVDSEVAEMEEDPSSIRFWRETYDPTARPRVWLRVVRVADRVLARDAISAVPILSGMGPIAFGNATNFAVKAEEISPLNLLWRRAVGPRSTEVIRESLERDATLLERKTLQDLWAVYVRRGSANGGVPRVSQAVSTVFERDPYVRAIARKRANFECEVPNCNSDRFETATGEMYCEVHHILPLADGGTDTPENAACVCPNHHRELHVGTRRHRLAQVLQEVRESDATVRT